MRTRFLLTYISLTALATLVTATTLFAAPIHDAAKQGDTETVLAMIAHDPTMLEIRDEIGASPLYLAAQAGHSKLVAKLIALGAEVTVATTDGLTALHWTSLNGDITTSTLLLDNGADVNARSRVQNITPLHETWLGGHDRMARLLIERGADVDAVDEWYGNTILHFAVINGQVDLVETLLAASPDMEIRNNVGRTPANVRRGPDMNSQHETISLMLRDHLIHH